MQDQNQNSRILAIDLRARKFGYAVFEEPKRLIDWGSSTYPSGEIGAHVASQRVAVLLKLFHPSTVVIKKDRCTGVRKISVVKDIIKQIRRETASRSTPVVLIGHRTISRVFRIFRVHAKYDIATMLATTFPELLWRLPPKRKIWQGEHRRMGAFDAIAVGFAYLSRRGQSSVPPK